MKLIKMILLGICYGCTMMVLVQVIGITVNADFINNLTPADYIRNAICSVITGIAFTVPALVYHYERLAKGMQVLIHLGTGFAIYIPVAFYAQWIPTNMGFGIAVIILSSMLIGSLVIWLCFYLYYKREAKRMNDLLKRKQKN